MFTHFGLISALAATLLIVIAACDPVAELKPLPTLPSGSGYQLSSGDQVRVITFGEQALSGEFNIDDSGYVALPLLGQVRAEGLTTHELATRVAAALHDRRLLADPSVVVEVLRYRPIFVLGEVQHPGPFPYQPHMSLLSAVALAGGFTPRAVKNRAYIVRVTPDGTEEGILTPLGQVAPGDVITVLERTF